jgi:hypothetical protein
MTITMINIVWMSMSQLSIVLLNGIVCDNVITNSLQKQQTHHGTIKTARI